MRARARERIDRHCSGGQRHGCRHKTTDRHLQGAKKTWRVKPRTNHALEPWLERGGGEDWSGLTTSYGKPTFLPVSANNQARPSYDRSVVLLLSLSCSTSQNYSVNSTRPGPGPDRLLGSGSPFPLPMQQQHTHTHDPVRSACYLLVAKSSRLLPGFPNVEVT